MNLTRKKFALLMSALIIGQAATMQNMHGMDVLGGDNSEENANMTWNFWRGLGTTCYTNIAALANSAYAKLPASETVLNSSTARVALPLASIYAINTLSPYPTALNSLILIEGIAKSFVHVARAHVNNQPVTLDLMSQGLTEAAIGIGDRMQPSAMLAAIPNMIVNSVTNFLDNTVNKLETSGTNFTNKTKNLITTSVADITTTAKNVITNSGNDIVNTTNQVADNISDALTGLIEKPTQQIGIKLLRTGVPYIIGGTVVTATVAAILAKTYYFLKGIDTTTLKQPVFLATSADNQISLWQGFKNFIMRREKAQKPAELIFAPAVQSQLDAATQLTVNTFFAINKQNSSTTQYEPILLHGSAGTGKTSTAKKLVNDIYQQTNGKMAWGYTTAALVLENGINGINAMFAWAKKHNACIVIDDADVLQSSASNAGIVNHLLYTINEHAQNCTVIMTATDINNLSGSIRQRFANNTIHLPLPNETERAQVLRLCRDRIANNANIDAQLKTSLTEQLHDNKIAEIAAKTATLSNSDLHNIVNKIVNSSGKEINASIIDAVVAEYLKIHVTEKAK